MSPQRVHVDAYRPGTPEGPVYVGPGSMYANPFKAGGQIHLTGKRAGERSNAADVVSIYRSALIANEEAVATVRKALAGRDLACTCPLDQPCHISALLEVSNSTGPIPASPPKPPRARKAKR